MRSVADVVVSATLSDDPDHPITAGEIVGTGPIPQTVLERMLCNAAVTGVLFSGNGKALWCGRTRYRPTDGQMKALIERDGGCVGCGADPSRCEAHHIDPWARGGRTDIDNLVLLCWYCHRKVHHNDWQVTHRDGRLTIEPPERAPAHGPAHAPDRPPRQSPPEPRRRMRTRPTRGQTERTSRPPGRAGETTGTGAGTAPPRDAQSAPDPATPPHSRTAPDPAPSHREHARRHAGTLFNLEAPP